MNVEYLYHVLKLLAICRVSKKGNILYDLYARIVY